MRTFPLLLAGVVAALLAAATPAAAVTFAPAAGATVPATASGLAVGDLDGDGIPDAVLSDPGSVAVVALRGDGAGGFGAPVTLPVLHPPRDVRVGDVDRDGRLDVLYRADFGVGLLLNAGDGTLVEASGSPYASGSPPTGLGFAVGDVNGDRRLDAVVATEDGVRTMLAAAPNSGPATFATGPLTSATTHTRSLDLADVDGDRRLDLLVTRPASFRAHRADGAGDFTTLLGSYGLFNELTAIAAGDVDGDGSADAVVADGDGGQLFTLLNGGFGIVEAVVDVAVGGPPQFASLTLADFDRDGRLDAAVPAEVRTSLRVRPGDDRGRFGDWPEVALGSAARAVVAADADRDGAPDLFALAGGSVHVLLNEAAPAVVVDGGPLAFADQQRGTVSPLRQLTVRSTGALPLRVDDATIAGDAAGDFWIASDRCSGRTLAVGETCTLGVRFAPTAIGPRAAQVELATDAPAAPPAALNGTGLAGDPGPQGPPGDPGPQGPAGPPGADGRDGAPGRDGSPGRDGAHGVDGSDGAPGRDGASGRDGSSGRGGRPAAKPVCTRAGRALRCSAPAPAARSAAAHPRAARSPATAAR